MGVRMIMKRSSMNMNMRMKNQKSLLNTSMLMKNLLPSLATNLNANLPIIIILNLNLIIIITRVIFMDTGYQSILDIINQDMNITTEVMMEDTMEEEDIMEKVEDTMEEEDITERHLSQDL